MKCSRQETLAGRQILQEVLEQAYDLSRDGSMRKNVNKTRPWQNSSLGDSLPDNLKSLLPKSYTHDGVYGLPSHLTRDTVKELLRSKDPSYPDIAKRVLKGIRSTPLNGALLASGLGLGAIADLERYIRNKG